MGATDEYLVIKLCCFSCSCYVLSIDMMDANCVFLLILEEAAVPFSSKFLIAKKSGNPTTGLVAFGVLVG